MLLREISQVTNESFRVASVRVQLFVGRQATSNLHVISNQVQNYAEEPKSVRRTTPPIDVHVHESVTTQPDDMIAE